jgi:hypothetical protein
VPSRTRVRPSVHERHESRTDPVDALHAQGREADAIARARAAPASLAGAWPDLPEPEGQVDVSHEAFGEAAALIEHAADEIA